MPQHGGNVRTVSTIEEQEELKLDFSKIEEAAATVHGIIPVAIQNAASGEVILVAYTNQLAFEETVRTRTVVLWSTSRNELWAKGATSGNGFRLIEAYVNCEQNSLLYKALPQNGGICHTANRAGQPRNCFYRRINLDTLKLENIDR